MTDAPPPAPRDEEEAGGEAGTTLVELLVAMALLSLIALFAFQGIGSLRLVTPVGVRIAAAEEVAAVAAHLRRTLGEAVAELAPGTPAGFRGEAGGMRFLAPGDPLLEAGGLVTVTIAAEPQADGRLALVERRSPSRLPPDERRDRVVLLADLVAVRFAYAATGLSGEADWQAAWAAPALPALVRIEADGGPSRALTVLAHPVATGPAEAGTNGETAAPE